MMLLEIDATTEVYMREWIYVMDLDIHISDQFFQQYIQYEIEPLTFPIQYEHHHHVQDEEISFYCDLELCEDIEDAIVDDDGDLRRLLQETVEIPLLEMDHFNTASNTRNSVDNQNEAIDFGITQEYIQDFEELWSFNAD